MKSYARVRRWREEVELLEAEYLRVGISFEHEAQPWDKRAVQVPIGVIPHAEALGAIAFAKRQADMFRDMRQCSETTWTEGKLPCGKKRTRPRAQPTVVREIEMEDEEERIREEREKEEEEEAELVGGMVDSDDEEYVFSGMVDDD
jgi:hypothetical protein